MQPEILQLGESIRSVTLELIRDAGASPDRPMSIASILGVDKTLASRSAKAARASEPLSALLASPAPAGLEALAAAAQRHGVRLQTIQDLRGVIKRFEQVISSFPGGRSGLDSAVAGWLPEERETRSRAARQMVHKGMASLLNVTVDAAYVAYFFAPSETPGRYDGAFVLSQQGIRRLRHGFRVLVGGVSLDEGEPGAPRRCTLSGEALRDDPLSTLLPSFCRGYDGPISLVRESETALSMVLGSNDPPINAPASVTFGALTRNAGPSVRDHVTQAEYIKVRTRKPTSLQVLDLFVHDRVFSLAPPRPQIALVGATRPDLLTLAGPTYDEIDTPLDVLSLGRGTGGVHAAGVENVPQITAEAWRRLGWNPAEFRLYRLRVVYPIPTVELMVWFGLEPPTA